MLLLLPSKKGQSKKKLKSKIVWKSFGQAEQILKRDVVDYGEFDQIFIFGSRDVCLPITYVGLMNRETLRYFFLRQPALFS